MVFSGVLLFSMCILTVLLGEINLSSLYFWVSAHIPLPADCKCSCLPGDICLFQSEIWYSPHSILLLQIYCLLSVHCIVTCCTLSHHFEGECHCLTPFLTPLYVLLCQVVVLSRFLLSIPSVFLQHVTLRSPAIGFLPYTQGSQA